MKDIKDFLSKFAPRGIVSALKAKPEYISRLEEKYGKIDIKELIYLLLNDIDEIPKANCGSYKKFISVVDGYAFYCTKPKFGKNKCQLCSDEVQAMKKENYKENHGVENPAQLESSKLKKKKTNLERYGNEIPQRTDKVKKKSIQTMKEKYGVEHTSQLKENREKYKNTVLEKYGVHNTLLVNRKSLTERYNEYKNKFLPEFELLSTEDEYDKIGHHGIMKWKHVHCGRIMEKVDQCLRCPTCNPYSASAPEIELREYIISVLPEGTEVLNSVRNIISNREIDIFIPSLGIGIEYCGEYWHRSDIRDQKYHQEKAIEMKKLGYRLITIFGNEWDNKQELIKLRLNNILNSNIDVTYARKTTIDVLKDNSQESIDFQNKYHKQGSTNAEIQIALRNNNNEIIALMTFGKPRFNKTYQWELIRFCTKGTVVGAANKLLKHFERTFKPSSIMSYADMNWSTGNVYEKMGFELSGITKPGYFYYDPKRKISLTRYKCQKSKLMKRHGFGVDMTEYAMIQSLGYYKVYDCGNMIFVKKY